MTAIYLASYFVLGGLLAHIGLTVRRWEFWAILVTVNIGSVTAMALP